MKVSAFMDIYESLNSILVTLFNDIMNIEEKALITDEFKDISVNRYAHYRSYRYR